MSLLTTLPLIVCTPGRSGGSVLMQALRQHEKIVVSGGWPHEDRPAVSGSLIAYTATFRAGNEGEARGVLEDMATPIAGGGGYEERLFRNYIAKPLVSRVRFGVRAYYAHLAVRKRKLSPRWFAEKARPEHVAAVEHLFPGTRVILLVRDPRDAVVSAFNFFNARAHAYKEGPGATPFENIVTNCADDWRDIADFHLARRQSAPAPLLVRYEDMLAKPEQTLGAIFDALELKPCPAAAGAVTNAASREFHGTSQSADASMGRWRRDLTSAQQDFVSRAVARSATALGYS